VILQAYAAALLIVVGSVVIGRAICLAAAGPGGWWAAPGVGFAALIVLTTAALELPGRTIPAVALTTVALIWSVAFLWRRRSWPAGWDCVCAGTASLLAASLPFIASGRVGLPGVSLDDDTANFLLYTEALRSSRMERLWGPGNGYPLGPHGVAATVASATGIPLDMAFVGLLLAVIPITAMVAIGVLRRAAVWRRVLVGVMCSLPYLTAAYYAEGSFKETVMAVLLLAFVVHIDQLRTRAQPASARRWRSLIPPGLLLAAAVYTYSYVAGAWFGGTVAIWLAAEAVLRPRLLRRWISRSRLAELARWVGTSLVVIVILLVPVAGQIQSFFSSVGVSPAASATIPANALGNLLHPLPFSESLGVWWSPDFRMVPTAAHHHALSVAALGVLIVGLLWSVLRRQLLMAAAVAASLLIWWQANRSQSPYIAAKGLVIAAPLVMALDLRMLFSVPSLKRFSIPRVRWVTQALVLMLGVAFCACAAYSSELALRTEPVAAPAAGRTLEAFHRYIGDGRVLYLGDDPYATWELRAAAVSALDPNVRSVGDVSGRSTKPFGGQLDFDSVDPSSLDRVGYVITSNTPYASQPPSNFRLVASSTLFQLWQRTGPSVPRAALDPSGAPGAVFDCHTPLGRNLRRRHGEASVMATPVTVPGTGLVPGGSASIALPLPKGSWELSLQYVSDFSLTLAAQGHQWEMPATLPFLGQFFSVGRVVGQGVKSPVALSVRLDKPSRFTGSGDLLYASFPVIAATRVPDTRRLMPISRACGQYVDWYRLR
jgi:hypothetical protein